MRKFELTVGVSALACGVLFLSTADSIAATRTTTVVTRYNHIQQPVIKVIVNEQPVSFQTAEPIMLNGNSVYVPVRGVFEQMGGDVKWDAPSRVVNGARPGHQFR